jgi:hypothetical protein
MINVFKNVLRGTIEIMMDNAKSVQAIVLLAREIKEIAHLVIRFPQTLFFLIANVLINVHLIKSN